ncbi:MAG TPA: acetyl-CoA carboxylase, carboxyltransferase subunit beta [Alphaproteobacteria bacterium]|nr:acetyl-CoA carboxylase, carboxyltransferase subunit beta [Alphaproteobacteria bacterium]
MNWLTNFVRPKIRSLVSRRDTPENLWSKCPACGQMIFHRDLAENLHVCPNCDNHLRIGPKERFAQLFDEGDYQPIALPAVTVDPLRFRDQKRYLDRLKDIRNRTGEEEAMAVAHGKMGGQQAVVVVQNFAFMGGSMGLATGEALVTAARLAVMQEAALVVFAAAGGARMQEGILSLMQMPRTAIAVELVREARLPYIVVLTDPTTGGVTASYGMLGDISIGEPGALIGFAGPRVIEDTIREQLPEGFQRAEFLLEHGMLDMVVPRREMRATLIRLFGFLMAGRAAAALPDKAVPAADEIPALAAPDAAEPASPSGSPAD